MLSNVLVKTVSLSNACIEYQDLKENAETDMKKQVNA